MAHAKADFLNFFPLLDYPGCTKPASYIDGSGFSNPSYNGRFSLSKTGNDLVLYNYHAVFEKGDYCIWFANDHYWHMGNCNNLGENSVYILRDLNKECPNSIGSWFSVNKSLGESGKTEKKYPPDPSVQRPIAAGSDPYQNAPTASVTYQVRDGRYFQKCQWKKSPGGYWRCVTQYSQGIKVRKLKYIKAFTFKYLLFSVNCKWSSWSSFTSCSKTCGSGGTQSRTRSKTQVEKYGGSPCSGSVSDSKSCFVKYCPGRYLSNILVLYFLEC